MSAGSTVEFLWLLAISSPVAIGWSAGLPQVVVDVPDFYLLRLIQPGTQFGRSWVGTNRKIYFYLYWVGEAIGIILGFLVLFEVFKNIFRQHSALRKLATLIFTVSLVLCLRCSFHSDPCGAATDGQPRPLSDSARGSDAYNRGRTISS